MYQFYQIMICLLKFDFFCFIGVTTQVRLSITTTDGRSYLRCLALDCRAADELG